MSVVGFSHYYKRGNALRNIKNMPKDINQPVATDMMKSLQQLHII